MRFGLIIPSSNTTMEAEFWRMASGLATVHAARIRLKKITFNITFEDD
jgi:maleate isomerase